MLPSRDGAGAGAGRTPDAATVGLRRKTGDCPELFIRRFSWISHLKLPGIVTRCLPARALLLIGAKI